MHRVRMVLILCCATAVSVIVWAKIAAPLGFSLVFRPLPVDPGLRQRNLLGRTVCPPRTRENYMPGRGVTRYFQRWFPPLRFVILILSCAWASLPKVGAGCGNAARSV